MDNPYWDRVNRIAERQRNKGLAEYGKGIETNSADIHSRIEMALEELVDLAMYLCWVEDFFNKEKEN